MINGAAAPGDAVRPASWRSSRTRTPRGWVNQRIIYTHGIGVAMVPVNEVTNEGQPELFIRNLPPVSVRRRPDDHRAADLLRRAAVGLRRRRRPAGRVRLPDRRGRRHGGETGDQTRAGPARPAIKLDTTLVAAALRAPLPRPQPAHQRPGHRRQPAPVPPLARGPAQPHRAVPAASTRTRTSSSTASGRLVYIQDAYTTSDRFPNAQAFDPGDARQDPGSGRRLQLHPQQREDRRWTPTTGRCTSTSPTRPIRSSGPTRASSRRCSLRSTEMPADLQAPPARPRGAVQRPDRGVRPLPRDRPAAVLPRRDDLLDGPDRDRPTSRRLPSEAYYVVMRMPGEANPEFLLLQPMVPVSRPNMIAWVAARNDAPNYGTTRVYRFPPDTTVFGPTQIEARIDQDPIISRRSRSGTSRAARSSAATSSSCRSELAHLPPAGLPPVDQPRRSREFQRIVVASTPERRLGHRPSADAIDLLLAAEARRRRAVADTAADAEPGRLARPRPRRRRRPARPGRRAAADRRGRPDRVRQRALRAGPGRAPDRRLRDLRPRDRAGPGGARASSTQLAPDRPRP